jgi:hypothetical protein
MTLDIGTLILGIGFTLFVVLIGIYILSTTNIIGSKKYGCNQFGSCVEMDDGQFDSTCIKDGTFQCTPTADINPCDDNPDSTETKIIPYTFNGQLDMCGQFDSTEIACNELIKKGECTDTKNSCNFVSKDACTDWAKTNKKFAVKYKCNSPGDSKCDNMGNVPFDDEGSDVILYTDERTCKNACTNKSENGCPKDDVTEDNGVCCGITPNMLSTCSKLESEDVCTLTQFTDGTKCCWVKPENCPCGCFYKTNKTDTECGVNKDKWCQTLFTEDQCKKSKHSGHKASHCCSWETHIGRDEDGGDIVTGAGIGKCEDDTDL